MQDKGSVATDWGAYSAEISARKEGAEWAVLRRLRAEHYERFFRIEAGMRVLDAGCGHGEYMVFAAADGARVWGIDTSESMLRYTREHVARKGLSVEELSCQSIFDIQYPDDSFDVVFNLSVLECVEQPEQALAELVRVLRPGGQLYIDVSNAAAVHWYAVFRLAQIMGSGPAGNMRYFYPGELSKMVRQSGCKPLESCGQSFSPPFSGVYTPDLRRHTFLPESMIRALDELYLRVERFTNHSWPFRNLCWHYFLKAEKLPPAASRSIDAVADPLRGRSEGKARA